MSMFTIDGGRYIPKWSHSMRKLENIPLEKSTRNVLFEPLSNTWYTHTYKHTAPSSESALNVNTFVTGEKVFKLTKIKLKLKLKAKPWTEELTHTHPQHTHTLTHTFAITHVYSNYFWWDAWGMTQFPFAKGQLTNGIYISCNCEMPTHSRISTFPLYEFVGVCVCVCLGFVHSCFVTIVFVAVHLPFLWATLFVRLYVCFAFNKSIHSVMLYAYIWKKANSNNDSNVLWMWTVLWTVANGMAVWICRPLFLPTAIWLSLLELHTISFSVYVYYHYNWYLWRTA